MDVAKVVVASSTAAGSGFGEIGCVTVYVEDHVTLCVLELAVRVHCTIVEEFANCVL